MVGLIQRWWRRRRDAAKRQAAHLETGRWGESLAREELLRRGLVFLAANYRGRHGEIDLVFREADCLVFTEVKTRSNEDWVRPAAAVDRAKRRRLMRTAEEYVRRLPDSRVKWRFDVVEVVLRPAGPEVRHLPNAFGPDDVRSPRWR